MYARIPFATNPSGTAQPTLLSADGYLVTVPAITQTYTTLRTLSTVSSETTAPVAGTFSVSIPRSSYADVLIVGSAVGGTVTPDSIIWKIWRLVGTIVEQVDQIEVDAVNIAVPITRTVPSGTDKLWITATLVAGTSPTVSAVVSIRPIDNGGMTQSKLSTDTLGNLLTRSNSYDSPTNSDKVFPVYDVSDKYASETPISITGTSLVTSNFDISMIGYRNLGIQIIGTSGVDGYIKFAIQTTKDPNPSTTNFSTITGSVIDLVTGLSLAPNSSGDVIIPLTSTNYDLVLNGINTLVVRIKVTVTAHANNVLNIFTYKNY